MRRKVKYGQVWAYYGDVQCMAVAPDRGGRAVDGSWRVLLLAVAPGKPYVPEPGVDRFIIWTLETQDGWEEVT